MPDENKQKKSQNGMFLSKRDGFIVSEKISLLFQKDCLEPDSHRKTTKILRR